MGKFVRASFGAGLAALSLVTGLAANADASTEFAPKSVAVSSVRGGPTPERSSYAALNVAVAATTELFGPTAGLILSAGFEFAEEFAGDSLPAATRKLSEAQYQKAADANFDSETATAG